MKNLILYISLLFIGHSSFSQEVVWQKLTPCEKGSNPDYMHTNRLINKETVNDTLNIKIGVVRNCGFNSKIDLYSNKDSLILDIQNTSEIFGVCLCYFEIDIKITGLLDTNHTLYYNTEKIEFGEKELIESTEIKEFQPFSHKYIFPTFQEINAPTITSQLYQDSLKIGIWNYNFEKTTKLKTKVYYYIDPNGKSKVKWLVKYNYIGEVEEVCATSVVESLGLVTDCIEYNEYLDLIKTKP